MVDLHGLRVNEAIKYANQEFQSVESRSYKVIRFIVGTFPLKHWLLYAVFYGRSPTNLGKGIHSKGGVKIRPAMEKLCKK